MNFIILHFTSPVMEVTTLNTSILVGTVGVCVLGLLAVKRRSGGTVSLPRNIVITGSTKGIGLALAKEFLKQGHKVVVSSRSEKNLTNALEALNKLGNGESNAFGCTADVTDYDSVANLCDFAVKNMGTIDIWINNAGISQPKNVPLTETDHSVIRDIINTNVIGSLYGTKAAALQMKKQELGGHIFLMDGAGSNGMKTATFATYGVSKAGIPQLLGTLVKETKGTNIGIHALSPGMVITDLLMKSSTNQDERPTGTWKIFNTLAEKPSTVASWMVPKVLSAAQPQKTGTYHKFLTTKGAIWRFANYWRRQTLINEETGEILFSED